MLLVAFKRILLGPPANRLLISVSRNINSSKLNIVIAELPAGSDAQVSLDDGHLANATLCRSFLTHFAQDTPGWAGSGPLEGILPSLYLNDNFMQDLSLHSNDCWACRFESQDEVH